MSGYSPGDTEERIVKKLWLTSHQMRKLALELKKKVKERQQEQEVAVRLQESFECREFMEGERREDYIRKLEDELKKTKEEVKQMKRSRGTASMAEELAEEAVVVVKRRVEGA